MNAFREMLAVARHVVVLTGAGVSAESGVPTFRGAGGYWRTYQVINTCMETSHNIIIFRYYVYALYTRIWYADMESSTRQSKYTKITITIKISISQQAKSV